MPPETNQKWPTQSPPPTVVFLERFLLSNLEEMGRWNVITLSGFTVPEKGRSKQQQIFSRITSWRSCPPYRRMLCQTQSTRLDPRRSGPNQNSGGNEKILHVAAITTTTIATTATTTTTSKNTRLLKKLFHGKLKLLRNPIVLNFYH